MKKILLHALGTTGDIQPLLGVGKELLRRGYKVAMLSSENYRQIIEGAGCEFLSVMSAEDHAAFLAHPDFWTDKAIPFQIKKYIIDVAPKLFNEIEQQKMQTDCALLFNHSLFGALIAAEKLKIPAASCFLSPQVHISTQQPARNTPKNDFILKMAGSWGRKLLVNIYLKSVEDMFKPLNAFRAELGLAPIKDFWREWRYSSHLLLNFWPEWFAPAKADWPDHLCNVGFVKNDDKSTPSWIDRLQIREFLQTRPIVFTLGSGMIHDLQKQVDLFSKTCELLNRTGILVSPIIRGEGVRLVDSRLRIIEQAPFTSLFQYASAIVCHGGMGTLSQAIASEKPVIATPIAFDQFENGYRVETLGVGRSIPYHSLNPLLLGKLISNLEDAPGRETTSRMLAEKMQNESGARAAADLVEKRLLMS